MNRITRIFQRKASTVRLLCAGVLSLSALAVTGCFQDKTGAYKSTVDKNGDLVAPADAKLSPSEKIARAKEEVNTPKLDKDTKESKADRTPTEKDLGLAFYPGAMPRKTSADLPLTTQSDTATLLTLETADPVEKVDTFYKEHLHQARRMADTLNSKAVISYMDYSDPTMIRSVDITQEQGKTVIALIASKAPAKPASPAPSTTVPPSAVPEMPSSR